jgi:hypothetical protein
MFLKLFILKRSHQNTNLSVSLSLIQLSKTFCLPYAYVISSTKLVIRADRTFLELSGGCGKGGGRGQGREMNVCTCE